MNQQREIIYSQRKKVLDGENLNEFFDKSYQEPMLKKWSKRSVNKDIPKEEWYFDAAKEALSIMIPDNVYKDVCDRKESLGSEEITRIFTDAALATYAQREASVGEEMMREIERVMLLYAVDKNWMEHIDTIDQLRYSIGLRSIGHHDPVVEYKFEAFEMFDEMNKAIRHEALRFVFTVQIKSGETIQRKSVAVSSNEGAARNRGAVRGAAAGGASSVGENAAQERRKQQHRYL